jgi:uncharacterized RDD family membrane protein YckC
MRCPKCRYISFDEGDKCRNCGYDFSLIQPDAPLDLPIRSLRDDEAVGPMADLRLKIAQKRQAAAAALTPPAAGQALSLRQAGDLPLFNQSGGTERLPDDAVDDRPLVSGNAPPRPPLAVRRSAPSTPSKPLISRPRAEEPPQEEPALDFADWAEVVREERVDGQGAEPEPRTDGITDTAATASAGSRLFGALVDAVITLGIDWSVLYFTLRVSGLQLAEIRLLPVVPMAAFLLLLNGGYFTIFTAAGGQTVGKMLARTRVVPSSPSARQYRLPFGTAVVRTAASLVSVVPAGVGFFMALFRADGRALHDAVADTRVVKA